jgi:cytochrome c-type biogenesis protein CcmH
MMFWIAAAALMGLTCLALLTALGGRRASGPAADAGHDRRFYEAQIAEIERQKGLGLMGDAEAEAARTEAARRLLAAAPAEVSAGGGTGGRRLAAIAVLIGVPAVALPVYIARGTPEMPGFPLASRPQPPPQPGGQVDVASALQQIEAHLQRNPQDGRGHEVVAPVYLRMGRHAEAVRSYTAALRILGPTAERHASLGEALVYQAEGVVTAEAKAAFSAALAIDPTHVKARFFAALAVEQDGDRPKAVDLFSSLRQDLPEGQLKDEITRQLAALGGAPKGGDAIAGLPQGQQQQAVRAMVEGLSQRLATNGGPAADWARLIRALTVLGERERAGAILAEARQKFAGDADELKQIEDAARATP